MVQISTYILTFNCEETLAKVLDKVQQFSDDIVILDSGSSDNTLEICKQYPTRIYHRKLDNFPKHRNFAIEHCQFDWVISLDSDEVPSAKLIEAILAVKKDLKESYLQDGFPAYSFKRHWFLLGKPVRALYPVKSPDFPLRFFNREAMKFPDNDNWVHETPRAHKPCRFLTLPGEMVHLSFRDCSEIIMKLDRYSSLAAQQMIVRKKAPQFLEAYLHAWAAFVRYYFFHGNILDGWVGWLAAKYAFDYTFFKYIKAMQMNQQIEAIY